MNSTQAVDRILALFDSIGLALDLVEQAGGQIRGVLSSLSGEQIPLQLIEDAGKWRLQNDNVVATIKSLSSLGALFGNEQSLKAMLPSEIFSTLNLDLQIIHIAFSPNLDTLAEVSTSFQLGQAWELIPGALSVDDPGLLLIVREPLGVTRVKGLFKGIVRVGGISIPVKSQIPPDVNSFAIPDAVKNWKLALDDIPFDAVNIEQLLAILGIDSLLNLLPPAFRNIAARLSNFDFDYDLELATLSTIDLGMALGEMDMALDLGIFKVIFAPESVAVRRSKQGDWDFSSDASIMVQGLPASLQDQLPEKIGCKLIVDSDDVRVEIDQPIEIPDISTGLRTLQLQLDNYKIRMKGEDIFFESRLIVDSGKDALTTALGFNPMFLRDQLKFRLILDGTDDDAPVRLTLEEWPFVFGELGIPIDGLYPVDLDLGPLGDFGEIKVQLPEFVLTEIVSGLPPFTGMIKIEDASIPIPVIPDLAAAVGLGDVIPRQIAIVEDGEAVSLQTQLRGINCAPIRLVPYTSLQLPTEFKYKVKYVPEGALDISVEPNTADAITTLVPSTFPLGIQVKKAGFGERWGLKTFLFSAEIDLFNLPYLLARSALGCNDIPLLPAPKDVRFYFNFTDVRLLLIPPIPIPIFFNPIELQYVGFEGFQFATKLSFEEPTLAEQVSLAMALFNFITQPDAVLSDEDLASLKTFKAEPLLQLRLPEYLGGSEETELKVGFELDPVPTVQMILNLLKNPSLAALVEAVDPKFRCFEGNILSFGPIKLEAALLIATLPEIENGTCLGGDSRAIQIAMSAIEDDYQPYGKHDAAIKPQLSKVSAGRDTVVVAQHVKGALGGIADGEATFALAILGRSGIATGFALRGSLFGEDMLAIELTGVARVANVENKLELFVGGRCLIRLFGRALFEARLQLSNDAFVFWVAAETPDFIPLQGRFVGVAYLDSGGRFMLYANAEVRLGLITLGKVSLMLRNRPSGEYGDFLNQLPNKDPQGEEVTLMDLGSDEWRQTLESGIAVFQLELFGQTASLTMKENLSLSGNIHLCPSFALQTDAIKEPNTGITLLPRIEFGAGLDIDVGVTIGLREFRIHVSGSAELSYALGELEGKVEVSIPSFSLGWSLTVFPTTLDQLIPFLKEVLLERAYDIANSLLPDAPEWLVNVGRQIEAFFDDPIGVMTEWVSKVGHELVKLRSYALEGMGKWNSDTWHLAVTITDPKRWGAMVKWDSKSWDIAENWGLNDLARAIDIPLFAWGASPGWGKVDWDLAFKLDTDDWAKLKDNVDHLTGVPLNEALEDLAGVISGKINDDTFTPEGIANGVKSWVPKISSPV